MDAVTTVVLTLFLGGLGISGAETKVWGLIFSWARFGLKKIIKKHKLQD